MATKARNSLVDVSNDATNEEGDKRNEGLFAYKYPAKIISKQKRGKRKIFKTSRQKKRKYTLYLHVGPYKTASTYLQKTFYDNSAILEQKGVVYPEVFLRNKGHHELFDEIKALRKEKDVTSKLKLKKPSTFGSLPFIAGIKKLTGINNNVILSSEGFSGLTKWELRLLHSLLSVRFNVKIVYYYRSPSARAISTWQETVKHKNTISFEQFKKLHFDFPSNYPTRDDLVVQQFGSVFGKENIYCIYFERAVAEKAILKEFLKIIGTPDLLPESNNIANKGLDFSLVELLRYLNNKHGHQYENIGIYVQFLKIIKANPNWLKTFNTGISKYFLPYEIYKQPEDIYISDNLEREFGNCFVNKPLRKDKEIVHIPDPVWMEDFELLAVAGNFSSALKPEDGVAENSPNYLGQHQSISSEERKVLHMPPKGLYSIWYSCNKITQEELLKQEKAVAAWTKKPLISIIIPTYNSKTSWLRNLLDSLLHQSYNEWECLLVDDGSSSHSHFSTIEAYCGSDGRFRFVPLKENKGVSAACQEGLDLSKGSYVCVVDHDDLIEPNALYEVAQVINHKMPDVIYSDEAQINNRGKIVNIYFRTDYNYYRLLSSPYIIHLAVYNKEIVLKAGGFDKNLHISQDYDLLLRVAALTESVVHIPKVLYKWRVHKHSSGHKGKAQVMQNSLFALNRHLQLKGYSSDIAVVQAGLSFNFFRVRYKILPCIISIIIWESEKAEIKQLVDSFSFITALTENVKLEIIVAGSSLSTDSDMLNGVQVFLFDSPIDYKALNTVAGKATGDYLLFLNGSAVLYHPDWLASLIELFTDTRVGAIGPLQTYDSVPSYIKSAGKFINNGKVIDDHHYFREFSGEGKLMHGHVYTLHTIRETTALDQDCLAIRRDLFEQMGGFDEGYANAYGDVDFCLRLKEKGYLSLFTPYARVVMKQFPNPERTSSRLKDKKLFYQKWQGNLGLTDPYYHPHLDKQDKLFWPVHPSPDFQRRVNSFLKSNKWHEFFKILIFRIHNILKS